jgi:hypothetical protein
LAAAHFALEDRDLAHQVHALQKEMSAMIREGPQSASQSHMGVFADRLDVVADQSADVTRAIGEAIRQAPTLISPAVTWAASGPHLGRIWAAPGPHWGHNTRETTRTRASHREVSRGLESQAV